LPVTEPRTVVSGINTQLSLACYRTANGSERGKEAWFF